MKYIVKTSILLGLIATNMAFASTNFGGTYKCKGFDPTIKPSAFTGTIKVVKTNKQYLMNETDVHGSTEFNYNQFGIKHGDLLVIAFQQANKPSVFGTQYMQIQHSGKRLEGKFSYWNLSNKIETVMRRLPVIQRKYHILCWMDE